MALADWAGAIGGSPTHCIMEYLLISQDTEEFSWVLDGGDIVARQTEVRNLVERYLRGPCVPFTAFMEQGDLRRWLWSAVRLILDHFYHRAIELEICFTMQVEVNWTECLHRAIDEAKLINPNLTDSIITRVTDALTAILDTQARAPRAGG